MRSSTVTVTNVHKPVVGASEVKPISASSTQSPNGLVVAMSFVAVALAAVVMCLVLDKGLKPEIFHTVTGYIPLAGIVAISTALERFLEPISNMIQQLSPPGTSQQRRAATEAAAAATKAMHDSEATPADAPDKEQMKQAAANALVTAHANARGLTASQAANIATAAAVDPQLSDAVVAPMVQTAADKMAQVRADKTVVFWALASICGLAISGSFGFLLLQAISSQHVNQCLDLIVTGLVIGAGTKPLHDLITGMQSK